MKASNLYILCVASCLITQLMGAKANFNPNKWYRVQPLGHEKVWDIPHNDNGTQVCLHAPHGGNNQQFRFKKTRYSTWVIHPRSCQHKVLDIQEGSEENGVSLLLWNPQRPHTHKNQEFTLTRIGGPLYRIQNLKSGLSLCKRAWTHYTSPGLYVRFYGGTY